MEFFGIGLPELLVILVLTLIVVGPQRLPEVAAQIGRTIREFRRYSSGVTKELLDAVQDLENEYQDLRGELKSVSGELLQQGRDLREGTDGRSGRGARQAAGRGDSPEGRAGSRTTRRQRGSSVAPRCPATTALAAASEESVD